MLYATEIFGRREAGGVFGWQMNTFNLASGQRGYVDMNQEGNLLQSHATVSGGRKGQQNCPCSYQFSLKVLFRARSSP